MPLPPALAAKLAKRGLIQTQTSAFAVRNKENSNEGKDKFVEEVIAESYDDPSKGTSSTASLANRNKVGASGIQKFERLGHYGCPNKVNVYHTVSFRFDDSISSNLYFLVFGVLCPSMGSWESSAFSY